MGGCLVGWVFQAAWTESERFAAADCGVVCAPAPSTSSTCRASKHSSGLLQLVEMNELFRAACGHWLQDTTKKHKNENVIND